MGRIGRRGSDGRMGRECGAGRPWDGRGDGLWVVGRAGMGGHAKAVPTESHRSTIDPSDRALAPFARPSRSFHSMLNFRPWQIRSCSSDS